jgi:protein-L-isoaspartate(D-aspartate) O-methyltransferase
MANERTLRKRLVAELQSRGFLRSGRIVEAFETVPRHLFVPGQPLKDIYSDRAFITKEVDGVGVSSSSQPSIMAIMLEQLEVQPGQRVLEIGAGTGYNAALLARLAGPRGRVTTVDIDPDTAAAARAHLRAAGYGGVRVVAGDGGHGWPDRAPYDRIIATAACWQIPQPWIDQLAEGGVLVAPLALNGAHVSLALRKEGDTLFGRRASECGFMPLRGAFGGHGYEANHDDTRISADVPLDRRLQRSVARLAAEPPREVRLPFPRGRDRRNTPLYYLLLQGRPALRFVRRSEDGRFHQSFGMASPESVILLGWERPKRGRVRLLGTDEGLRWLETALVHWKAAGRPDVRRLRARVKPSRSGLGALPRPSNGRYRFRRGDHLYELWFER